MTAHGPMTARVAATIALAEATGHPVALRLAARAREALSEAQRMRDTYHGARPVMRQLTRALRFADQAARAGAQPPLPW